MYRKFTSTTISQMCTCAHRCAVLFRRLVRRSAAKTRLQELEKRRRCAYLHIYEQNRCVVDVQNCAFYVQGCAHLCVYLHFYVRICTPTQTFKVRRCAKLNSSMYNTCTSMSNIAHLCVYLHIYVHNQRSQMCKINLSMYKHCTSMSKIDTSVCIFTHLRTHSRYVYTLHIYE